MQSIGKFQQNRVIIHCFSKCLDENVMELFDRITFLVWENLLAKWAEAYNAEEHANIIDTAEISHKTENQINKGGCCTSTSPF